jgi:hypothetical protein
MHHCERENEKGIGRPKIILVELIKKKNDISIKRIG